MAPDSKDELHSLIAKAGTKVPTPEDIASVSSSDVDANVVQITLILSCSHPNAKNQQLSDHDTLFLV
jgi:hypothetical protein